MNVSSDKKKNAFECLKIKQVCILLDALQHSNLKTHSHIKRVFLEDSQNFNETVDFLYRLSIVGKKKNLLVMNMELPATNAVNFGASLLDLILWSRNRYRSEIFRFISCFKVVDAEISYHSPDHKRSSESAVRNFLMEMEVVHYESKTDRYMLADEYVYLYAKAHDDANKMSPSFISNTNAANDEIGYAAEKAIIEFEKERIGRKLAHHVKHVAKLNVAAGYDVRSITVDNGLSITPRFIEVKAVPKQSFRFYWARNEVAVAEALGHWYYLYLLPVTKNGLFDLQELKVITDPFKEVLGTSTDWISEPNVLQCYLRSAKALNS